MQQSNLDVEEATMGDETVLCLVWKGDLFILSNQGARLTKGACLGAVYWSNFALYVVFTRYP
jgi:hypothetical protein